MKKLTFKVFYCILAICVGVSALMLPAYAAPTDSPEELLVLDCSSKSQIEQAGAVADTTHTNGKTYAAKWTFRDNSVLVINNGPTDITDYKNIKVSIYVDSPAELYFRLTSENTSTDGDDYYGYELPLSQGSWYEYVIPIHDMSVNRSPLGYDQIDSFQLFSTGWDMNNDMDTVVWVGDIVLTNEEAPVVNVPAIQNAICLRPGIANALVNQKKVPIDSENENVVPYLVEDRTMVPLRFVAESLGAQVSYDPDTERITIQNGADTLKLVVGSDELNKNGSVVMLDVPAAVSDDDRTFVPLRAIAEAFGKEVFWDDMGLIVISDKKDIFNREYDLASMLDVMAGFTYDRPTGEQMVSDLLVHAPAHPRILASASDFERIRELSKTDETLKSWIEQIRVKANWSLETPRYSVDVGGRFNGTNGSTCLPAALMYQLTGDTQYADKVYAHLSGICDFADWHPGHFLDAAGIMQNVSIAYDWIYDALTPEQRNKIADAIYNKGVLAGLGSYHGTSEGIQSPQFSIWHRSGWIDSDNNWNAVCNAGITIASIAVADNPAYQASVEEVLGYIIRGIEKGVRCYAPDGGYAESTSYWSYGTTNLSLMIAALDSAMGTDYGLFQSPGLDVTGYFPNYMEGAKGSFNYHDAGEGFTGTDTLMWFGKKLQDPDLAGIRYNDIINGRKALSIYDILFYDPENLSTDVALPPDKLFSAIDTLSMRSSWTDDNAIFAALHGGSNTVNHCNLDSGTFVMDAGGVRWFCDLGSDYYNLPGYFETGVGGRRWNYYRQRAEGHNAVLINPGYSEDQIINSTSKITAFVSKPRGSYAVVDLTDAYRNDVTSAQRGMWLTNNRKALIVQDEIQMPQTSDFWWFAHTTAAITVSDDGRSAILEKDGKRLWAGVVSPMDSLKFEVMAAEPLSSSPQPSSEGQYDRSSYRKLAIHTRTDSVQLAVVFKLLEEGQSIPDFQYTYQGIDSWSIPDGALSVPALSSLSVGGSIVPDFDPAKTYYSVKLPYGTQQVPEIHAAPDANSAVEISLPDALPGEAQIKVTDKHDSSLYTIYTVKLYAVGEIDVTASYYQEGNPPENSIDGDLATRWSADGEQWIRYDFANPRLISSVWIAFWKSTPTRKAIFDIQVSEDGQRFETVFSGQSTLTQDILEEFPITPVTVKSVKIIGHANTENEWNSILEVEFR